MAKKLEIGTQLLTAVLVAPVGQPTMGIPPNVVGRAVASTVAEYRYLTTEDDQHFLVATTSSPLIIENVDRPTTEREKLIGELRDWKSLGPNWDSEGAQIPDPASIEEAVSFVNALPEVTKLLPDAMLHPTGHAGLYWDREELYADIEFTGQGRLTYYVEHPGKGTHRGGVAYSKGNIPTILAVLLNP